MRAKHWLKAAVVTAAMGSATNSSATEFNFELWDTTFNGVLNNTLTWGASWRIEDPSNDLIGKSNLNPTVCSGVYQSCQGVHRTQSYPAQRLASAPGMASLNFDDGNLNYKKGDITQAPFKISQDLNIKFGNYGIFVRGMGIYDDVNARGFKNYWPNRVTPENFQEVGRTGDDRVSNRYFERTYGPGGVVRERRDVAEANEIGARYDLLDANFYGVVPYMEGERELIFRVGRQITNWGQSTVAVINSVNQAQPVNANSLYRLGFGLLEELFVPVGMIRAATEVADGWSVEAYYQYEWEPIELPTPGSFMSFADIGTDNLRGSVNAAFGGSPDDPEHLATPADNPLALITPTTLTIDRLADKNPRDHGQFGLALKHYAEWLNDGTELSLYFINYHSKLPYISFYSTDASCARREGNSMGIDATNTSEFLTVCPNIPATRPRAQRQVTQDIGRLIAERPNVIPELGGSPNELPNLLAPRPGEGESDAVPLDTAKLLVEYPEDLQMYGFSFTTTAGELSFQGEVSYRPNVPLQVAIVDLAFASFGPTLTRCHDADLGCAGATSTIGFNEAGDYVIYDNNDFVDANGNNPYRDTVNLGVGAAPGSARSFPNFIIPYRGGQIGENPPNSYIKGYIPGKVAQYNIGATQVLGASENWISADQVILLYELAATHVLNLPDYDKLQIEGPLSSTTHASAGADGSGADGSRLACSTNPSCSVGPDGLRFNPFQASRDSFADSFSWGYRVVGRISYESVLPGISVMPLFIWSQDIKGNSPGPGGNFVEGRKALNFLLETRYEKSYAFTIAYNSYFGGGRHNLYADRDNLGFFVKYQF